MRRSATRSPRRRLAAARSPSPANGRRNPHIATAHNERVTAMSRRFDVRSAWRATLRGGAARRRPPSKQAFLPVNNPASSFRAGPLAAAFALAALLAAGNRAASADTIHAATKAATPAGDAVALTVGLMLDNGDPNACGTAATLAVHVGDPVNFCYTITNASAQTLGYHTLDDSV